MKDSCDNFDYKGCKEEEPHSKGSSLWTKSRYQKAIKMHGKLRGHPKRMPLRVWAHPKKLKNMQMLLYASDHPSVFVLLCFYNASSENSSFIESRMHPLHVNQKRSHQAQTRHIRIHSVHSRPASDRTFSILPIYILHSQPFRFRIALQSVFKNLELTFVKCGTGLKGLKFFF